MSFAERMIDSASVLEALPEAGCRVCGSAEQGRVLFPAADYITGERFTVRRCDACGCAMTVPQPRAMERFYPRRYRRYSRLTTACLTRLYRWRVRGWAKRLGRPGDALEVGCGGGWMLQALRERGWSVVGTERSVESASEAASGKRLPVFVGALDALRPGPRFDVVILFHVLEHLEDPVAALRSCAGLLRPGGRVVVAVPNWGSWQARFFGPAWFHLDVPRHLWHFSPRTLSRALEASRLRMEDVSFASFEHDPYGWVQSALNRMGFPHNLLTELIMGGGSHGTAPAAVALMGVIGALLVVPSLLLSAASWVARSGAVMEAWSVNA